MRELLKLILVLRLSALPSSFSLLATGEVGPSPCVLRLAALTEYCVTSAFTTAAAL